MVNQMGHQAYEMPSGFQEAFLQAGFTHHQLILFKARSLEQRIFCIQQTAKNFWSKRTLEHHLNSRLFESLGQLPNNFEQTLSPEQAGKATRSFKDSYLLSPLTFWFSDMLDGQCLWSTSAFQADEASRLNKPWYLKETVPISICSGISVN